MLPAAFLFSCSNTKTYEEAMEENRERIEEPARLGDAQFLVEIKSLNMFQLELLKIAHESGYSSEMVNLGKDNISPFQTLDTDLTDVAKKEKFRLPTELSESHAARLAAVKEASRQEIDQKIIAEMGKINSEVLQKFTAQATEGSDPDVRAFAARKIGALRAHSEAVRRVEEGLLTTVKDE
jgi:putative membrane protein